MEDSAGSKGAVTYEPWPCGHTEAGSEKYDREQRKGIHVSDLTQLIMITNEVFRRS